MLIRIILGGAIALAMLAAPAEAASTAEWAECNDIDNLDDADRNIAACTRIINDLQESQYDRTTALSNRCALWNLKGEPDRALKDCNKAIAFDPNDSVLYHNRSIAWRAKGELDRGLADLDEAIRLDPNSAANYDSRAITWRYKGDFERAMADHNQSIRLDPSDGIAYDNRGRTLYHMGEFDRAITDHNEAARRRPKDPIVYVNRARAHLYSGFASQALTDINQATSLNPRDAYHAIWAEVIGHRNNVPSRLSQVVASLNTKNWPGPIIRLYIGELAPAAVLAATDDPSALRRRRNLCEANFFIGEWTLRRGDRQDAARLFQLAANDCPFDLAPWRAAREELRALGQTP